MRRPAGNGGKLRRPGPGRPPLAARDRRSKVIRIRATPVDLQGAQDLAEREQITVSDVGLAAIRRAIKHGSTG